MKYYQSADLKSVRLADPVFAPRIELAAGPMLKAVIEQTVATGRIAAFDLDWTPDKPFKPHIFWDSDVAKVLEGMAYLLALSPDPELENLYDSWVDKVVSAQQSDGYLNTHFTVVEPEKRFAKLHWDHELYCAGHLMEAAVAGFEALGKRKFLDSMCRYADYLDSVFGTESGKRRGWPGHQEIELGLLRLYRVTGNQRYLRLASYFIDDRGTEPNVFLQEGAGEWELFNRQAEMPIREQKEVYGHAVRALYFYAAVADAAIENNDPQLLEVCKKLFDNMANRRSYITGGIGSTDSGEALTADWDLPEATAYSESCAAIAVVFFAIRMLNYTGDVSYAEVLERVLYNNCLSGVSNSGDTFFYANPIAMNNTKNTSPVLNDRQKGLRQPWYDCSCCPTNYIRFLPELGTFIWSHNKDCAVLHIPAACKFETADFGAEVTGNYPADGNITITMTRDSAKTFRIRIPLWAKKFKLSVRGEQVSCTAGYVNLPGPWKSGDTVTLQLEITPRLVFPHVNIADSAGRTAIMRGPVVYAIESCDNPGKVHRCRINSTVKFTESALPESLGSSLPAVSCPAQFRAGCDDDPLYSDEPPVWEDGTLIAIPYYLWQNRGASDMRIFIPFV